MARNRQAAGADRPSSLRWYREVALTAAFYGVYSLIRNQFGSASVSPGRAFDNAAAIVRIEQALGLFFEPDLQRAFLGWPLFLRFWNLYYGSLHFVVTAGLLIFIYRRHQPRYRLLRDSLATMTGFALVGFSLFPLMPPRLLAAGGPYGGITHGGSEYAGVFVDTLARYPTLWSFNSETMQTVSNQYAAMPSLHVGWSLWCVLAALPLARRRWQRIVIISYPPATIFAIVITANHYWLDAAGGALVFLAGYAVANRLDALRAGRRSVDDARANAVLVS